MIHYFIVSLIMIMLLYYFNVTYIDLYYFNVAYIVLYYIDY